MTLLYSTTRILEQILSFVCWHFLNIKDHFLSHIRPDKSNIRYPVGISGPIFSNFGSREESEVAGFFIFSHVRMMGYLRLGLYNDCLTGLELTAGARNMRKATVKM